MTADDVRKYLIERRERLGLSQAAVATRMGAHQTLVSRLETGTVKDLSVDHVVRWSAALGLQASLQFREIVAVTFDLEGS